MLNIRRTTDPLGYLLLVLPIEQRGGPAAEELHGSEWPRGPGGHARTHDQGVGWEYIYPPYIYSGFVLDINYSV